MGDDLPAPHQFAVSRWIGHSITISGKHYAKAVPDELFERAAKTPAACAQRKASDGAGNEQKHGGGAERAEARNSAANFKVAGTCGSFPQVPYPTTENRKNGAGGNRTPVSVQSA
jgi:hypothetical protein